jgi:hypothetical protein
VERLLLSTKPMGVLFRLMCLAVLTLVAGQPRQATARTPERAEVAVKTGDVVLQTSTSSRSALIRRVSKSPWSHVGVVEVAADGVFVIEAVQPVSRTPWKAWRAKGVGGRVLVLRAPGLDEAGAGRVVAEAKKYLGRPYDARYRWDEERLYCSELVTKAFAAGAGLEVGMQQAVKSLDLSAADLALGPKLGIDVEQTLVTPASIGLDDDLVVVHSDFDER